MRILLFTSTFPQVGGVTTHINTLAAGLRARGHQVLVANPLGIQTEVSLLPGSLGSLSRRLLRLEPVYGLALLSARLRLARLLRKVARDRELCPDIWHAHDINAVLAAPGSLPVHLTVHGYAAYEAVSDGLIRPGGALCRRILADEARAYRQAVRTVTVDPRLAAHVTGLAPSAPAPHVLPNGVDTGRFGPDPADRERVRTRLGVASGERFVLCPRRLVVKNGVEVPVAALALLPESMRSRLRLVYAGDGPLRGELQQQVEAASLSDRVIFLGAVPQEEMPAIYHGADLAVIPSVESQHVQEATSLAALEAMASGVPVAASALGGLLQIISDGETGSLLPPGDAAALAELLSQWLDDPVPFERMAGQARITVQERFSLDRLVSEYLHLYTDQLQDGPLH